MKLRNKKTGEIIIPTDYTFATYDDGIKYGHHIYFSLAELIEEWEDYKPKEPLIKDEKIRKAVRAWAEANGDTRVYYCRPANQLCVSDNKGYVIRSIKFKLEFRKAMGLEDGEYTIAELCGEEEG